MAFQTKNPYNNKILKSYEPFDDNKTKALKVGNPESKNTYISVLAREGLAANLSKQLNESIKMGAKLISGGQQRQCFFEPTLVEDVTTEMPIFKEETFGPLLAVTKFSNDEQALELINQSAYGLGVSLFTDDNEKI